MQWAIVRRMTLKELAEALGGALNGDGSTEIIRCASIENAGKGSLVYVDAPKFLKELKKSSASAAIVANGMESEIPTIAIKRPALAFAKAMEILHPGRQFETVIHPTASIAASAKIGGECGIGPHVTVGGESVVGGASRLDASVSVGNGCTIGNGCIFYPGVTIYDGCIIGDRVILHAGVVIGSDGFKYVDDEKGSKVKVPHIGIVRIGDDVEIQANSCVDRAMLDETIIGNNVKIDNLVQVGHNTTIGDNTVIAGACGISGSVRIGKNVVMGGQVGVADHVEIADNVIIAAKTGVLSSIKKPGVYAGYMVQPIGEWRKSHAAYIKGPHTVKRVNAIERSFRKAESTAKGEKK